MDGQNRMAFWEKEAEKQAAHSGPFRVELEGGVLTLIRHKPGTIHELLAYGSPEGLAKLKEVLEALDNWEDAQDAHQRWVARAKSIDRLKRLKALQGS